MRHMKYIVWQIDGLPQQLLIFPAADNHSDHKPTHPGVRVLGAGAIQLIGGRMKCFGESLTLGVRSRPEDTIIANQFLNDDDY